MRIVLDTNIVVSGLLWSGAPSRMLQAIRDARISAFSSRALLIELTEVLGRPHLAKLIAGQHTNPEQLVRGYTLLAPPVPISAIEAVVRGDPDDDVLIATAVAARADLIVSGDRKVLAVGEHRGIQIVGINGALARI
ncbi:MAG: putative toxin-antitoxin system toxin component, PIN family [Burkholderiales bacterium]